MILALVVQFNWELDIKTTFLYGELDEDIYMCQSQGFEVKVK